MRTAEPQFAPLPRGDTLVECAAVTRAIEDEISWLAKPDTIGFLNTDSPRPPLYSLLALIDTFDGAMRIRKARPGELGSEHLLVIEGKHGWKGLQKDSTDAVISPAVAHGLLHFDDAGVLHVTDQGRALVGAKDASENDGDEATARIVETVAQELEALNQIERCIVQVTVIREIVMELEARLESQIPDGMERLHSQPLENCKPWVSPINQLGSVNGSLLDLISHLCSQRKTICQEGGA